jgi:hypothetical protein
MYRGFKGEKEFEEGGSDQVCQMLIAKSENS